MDMHTRYRSHLYGNREVRLRTGVQSHWRQTRIKKESRCSRTIQTFCKPVDYYTSLEV